MNIKEFADSIKNGKIYTVKFKNKIDYQESYFDRNMIANAINVGNIDHYEDGIDVIPIIFEFSEFEEHNNKVEKCNYWNSNGEANWSAKQAGMFPDNYKESVYFDSSENIEDYFDIVDNKRYDLPNKETTTNPKIAAEEWENAFYILKSALERIEPIPLKLIRKVSVASLDEVLMECKIALKLGKEF